MNVNNSAKKIQFAVEKKIFHEVSTSTDFLVPKIYSEALRARIDLHRNLRLYLYFLLNRLRSGKFIKSLPVFAGLRTKYQNRDENMVEFKFRPFAQDWIELMTIARAHGASATFVFVFLLEQDILNEASEIEKSCFSSFNADCSPGRPIRFLQILDLKRRKWRRLAEFCWSPYKIHEMASG
ncbi:MAG: DUF1564 domain-containing protein [Leptospira sp.]|nr:DUF1564 domain-containing protein [Leptospira sp.]